MASDFPPRNWLQHLGLPRRLGGISLSYRVPCPTLNIMQLASGAKETASKVSMVGLNSDFGVR